MADYRYVTYETLDEGTIARIMLNRPEARNAQNRGLLVELDEAFLKAEADDTVRVVILGGTGRCSPRATTWAPRRRCEESQPGPDQHPSFRDQRRRPGRAPRSLMLQEWHYFFENTRRWRNLRKITIAQVHGDVYAAALMLMWACDLIVAADDATLRRRGRHPARACAASSTSPTRGSSAPRKTKELMLTGDSLDVEEAHALGMVSKVFPADELADKTLEFARRIAKVPTMAALLIKESVNQTVRTTWASTTRSTRASRCTSSTTRHWAQVHERRLPGRPNERRHAQLARAPPVVPAVKDKVRFDD